MDIKTTENERIKYTEAIIIYHPAFRRCGICILQLQTLQERYVRVMDYSN